MQEVDQGVVVMYTLVKFFNTNLLFNNYESYESFEVLRALRVLRFWGLWGLLVDFG